MDSWTEMEEPCGHGEWRVPEVFRDTPLTLAMLDRFVDDFDKGCAPGRQEFVEYVVKSVVGHKVWRKEMERLELEARKRVRQECLERDLRYFLRDFQEGWIPRSDSSVYPAWQLWSQREAEKENVDG